MKKTAKWLITIALLCSLFFSPFAENTVSALTEEENTQILEARAELAELLSDHTVMALVYLSDTMSVYTDYSYDSSVIITVPSGQQVQIQDAFLDDACEAWSYVTFFYNDRQYTGYIPRKYLACSDELFLSWETDWNMNPDSMAMYIQNGTASYPDILTFPESYRSALLALKEAHPNWTFVKMDTGLDWNTVLANEMVTGRSLIPASFPEYMKGGTYSSSWALASEDTLEYYMDPRNWLTEEYIFMFEQLTYNASYHTEAAVQAFLANTFMSGTVPYDTVTYSRLFTDTGASLGVSPFHLACRVYQEQGKGTSALISGTYAGYEGLYNYFNVGASGATNTAVIESGLAYARQSGWTTPRLAIEGGSAIISANYILKGQDTLYLQKFDVDYGTNGLYWHQYMQNICAPSSEGYNIRKSYMTAGSLDNTFVFRIPVFNNMPDSCPKPIASLDVSLDILDGYTDATIYLDGVPYDATIKNDKYVVTAPDGNCKTATMYKYDTNDVPVDMYIWELSYNGIYTAAPVPELENLLSYHGFSIRITGTSGIRFKTGISADVRASLLGDGIAGYSLKEYGTLVMMQADYANYPFVKDGLRVKGGRSYGHNTDGSTLDTIFETVNGRYRYTSVLTGLPAAQYKTDFAFRGYIILTKNGEDFIFYGPPVNKNIYDLASYFLNMGYYPAGSTADTFLRQLVEDADRLEQ